MSEEAGRGDNQGTEGARGDKQGTEAEALWPEALRGLARELPSLGSVLRALVRVRVRVRAWAWVS